MYTTLCDKSNFKATGYDREFFKTKTKIVSISEPFYWIENVINRFWWISGHLKNILLAFLHLVRWLINHFQLFVKERIYFRNFFLFTPNSGELYVFQRTTLSFADSFLTNILCMQQQHWQCVFISLRWVGAEIAICISDNETIKSRKIKEDKNTRHQSPFTFAFPHIHTLLMNSQGLIHDIFILTATLIDAAAAA